MELFLFYILLKYQALNIRVRGLHPPPPHLDFHDFWKFVFSFACQDFWLSVPPYFQEQCYVPEYVWGNQTIVDCRDSGRISILETLHDAVHIITFNICISWNWMQQFNS